jgi:hypothetical protein
MRDLEKIRFIIKEATGLEIAYAYDDLVFSEYGVIIIQCVAIIENKLFCYFHKDCLSEDMRQMMENLNDVSQLNGVSIEFVSKFDMEQVAGKEEFQIKFL